MITYKDKIFNNWQEVVNQYPAMWVVFDQVDFDGAKVLSGHICVVLPDEEIIDYRHKHHGEIELSLRTTETIGVGGYIHGELINV